VATGHDRCDFLGFAVERTAGFDNAPSRRLPNRRHRVMARLLGAVLAAVTLVVVPGAASPAAHAADHHAIVLTFIRHAESEANAAGMIDTTVPGPDITPLGHWTGPRCGQ
jgi:hypothetical protein